MKIFKVGETLKAVCESCRSIVNATFALRDVPVNDGHGIVKNVLVGVCGECDCIVLVPQQSVPAITKQLDAKRRAVETRVPAHMVDILNLASSALGANADFSSTLIKHYIHRLSHEENAVDNLVAYLESDLATGHAQKRISIKGRLVLDDLNTLKRRTHLENTTDVLKAVVLKINDDVLITRKPSVLNELRTVAAAFV